MADVSKNLLKSKTFWVNILAGAVGVFGGPIGAVISPKVAIPAVAGINIALRWITKGPVHIFED